jgi:hypothetical protein
MQTQRQEKYETGSSTIFVTMEDFYKALFDCCES